MLSCLSYFKADLAIRRLSAQWIRALVLMLPICIHDHCYNSPVLSWNWSDVATSGLYQNASWSTWVVSSTDFSGGYIWDNRCVSRSSYLSVHGTRPANFGGAIEQTRLNWYVYLQFLNWLKLFPTDVSDSGNVVEFKEYYLMMLNADMKTKFLRLLLFTAWKWIANNCMRAHENNRCRHWHSVSPFTNMV